MSNWKASNYDGFNEFRSRIGLQFFAEGEDGGDAGADMDGFSDSDFETALLGDGLENQQPAEQQTGEGAADGAGNQRTEGPEENPGETGGEPPEANPAGGEPPAQQAQPVKMVYNGQQILLPGEAVQALTSTLGRDPVELLQKGMNYDAKAERELRILDQYAAASGMNRAQYLAQLEQAREQQQLAAEIEKARGEFPDTPDAALAAIAQSRRAAARAAEQQEQQRRQGELRAGQQRVQQLVEQSRQQAEMRAWDDYEKIAGVHKPEDIPPRVMALVQAGATPIAAHWQHQAELLQAQRTQESKIRQQQKQNRAGAVGSMAGAGEDAGDPFLRGFLNG